MAVKGQVFVVVNDEEDRDMPNVLYTTGKKFLSDWITPYPYEKNVAVYTGSTTGPKYDNEQCSPVGPATFHIDRKCNLLS